MRDGTSQPSTLASRTLLLLLTVVLSVGLVALLLFTARIAEDGPIGFLASYKDHISVGLVLLLGPPAVQTGAKWVFAVAQTRMSSDVAGALRVIARLVGYGLVAACLVSLLTENAVAALAMGSFAGVVAGFACQTVMATPWPESCWPPFGRVWRGRPGHDRRELRDDRRHHADAHRAGRR